MVQEPNLDGEMARKALNEIYDVQRRSAALRFYSAAGGDMFVWGLVWLFANSLSHVKPELSHWFWMVGIVIGAFASGFASYRSTSWQSKSLTVQQSLATFVVIALALTAIFMLVDLDDRLEVNALISMLVALSYCLAGIWKGVRMLIVGVAIGATVIIGLTLLRDWFEVWMGIVGGGLLMLSGIWFHKV